MMKRLALALLLGCLLLVAGASADPGDPWWNSGWEKRVPLTVTDASSTDGVQVLFNVTYDSDMQSDFGDLRFVQDDGITTIDYWIESKSDSNYALCWLELPAGETRIYLYYGAPDAESESDAEGVFDLYDSFSSLDTDKWQVMKSDTTGTVTVSGGELCIDGSGAGSTYITLRSKTAKFGTGYILEARMRHGNVATDIATYGGFGFTQGTFEYSSSQADDQIAILDFVDADTALYGVNALHLRADKTYTAFSPGIAVSTTARDFKIARKATSAEYECGASSVEISTHYSTAEMYVALGFTMNDAGREIYFDWVRVRKYVATEPTLSIGPEETVATTPTAAFTATPTAGLAPLTVQFTDLSGGRPTSWHWDFGDGNTSTAQNPVHTYTTPGLYTVTLTATNEYGSDEEIRTDYITVYGPVTAQFTATPTAGLAPLTVQFTDLSTGGPTSWLWDFGDGNTSTAQNPIHTYTTAGTHTVTLTASHPYDSDTETKTAYITVAVLQPFPGLTLIPRDLTGNGLYTDINGNNRLDYNDLTVFFQNLAWAKTAQPTSCFDFNGNNRLDYNDVITLFSIIMEEHT